jgi:polysaccharide export outer membrane protein
LSAKLLSLQVFWFRERQIHKQLYILQYNQTRDSKDLPSAFMEFNKMRALISFCFLCALAFALSSITSAQTTVTTTPKPTEQTVAYTPDVPRQGKDERYRIGFQDQLEIQVFRHPDLTQRVNVNTNGTISLFRLDEPIVAVCKTEQELSNDVAAAYEKDYLKNPQVRVIATEQRSRAFAVIGAVEKPGQYMISRRVRLLELLAQAGGPSKEAGTRVLVARTGSTSNCQLNESPEANLENASYIAYPLKDIIEGKENVVMRPGDIVSVLKADIVYVYGNVNKQGQIAIKEPLTLTQAIASAEGLKSASDKSNIRVLRQKPGSTDRDELVFDLNKINKREVADPFLEPNDVVAVNTDKTKEIFQSIGRSLTNGIPSLFYRVP